MTTITKEVRRVALFDRLTRIAKDMQLPGLVSLFEYQALNPEQDMGGAIGRDEWLYEQLVPIDDTGRAEIARRLCEQAREALGAISRDEPSLLVSPC